jgi:hypothetical protein
MWRITAGHANPSSQSAAGSQNPHFLSGHACSKSSGLRVIYYWHEPGSVILLLLAYPKNEQENLTPAQLKVFKSIIETEFP